MKKFISNVLTVCFICYMVLLVYFLFFSEEYGRTASYTSYRINLHLFAEIRKGVVYSGHYFRSFLFVTCMGFMVSLLVETVQLITKVGCFDVDDLFLNTAGVMLGYLCYYISKKMIGHMGKR